MRERAPINTESNDNLHNVLESPNFALYSGMYRVSYMFRTLLIHTRGG